MTIIKFNLDEEAFFKKHQKEQNIPRNDALKQIILKKIIKDFKINKTYHESEVNEIIKKYYEDFAYIRREFVNYRYMAKDSIKSTYTVIKQELTKGDYLKNSLLKKAAEEIKVL